MAVIHHGLRWDMTPAACDAARRIAARARADDMVGLGAEGRALYRRAQASPAALAAFDLADEEHVLPWLAPVAVHPALVTLLVWLPTMTVLAPDAAAALALARRPSPVAPLAATGTAFLPLASALRHLFGAAGGRRHSAGRLGDWARAATLERRLRGIGDAVGADRIADIGGGAPGTRWLVTTTLW